ncbi:sulfotransferase family protein [Pacificimonas sp. ICDLI1SI03]
MIARAKAAWGRHLFARHNVRRLHIVGCSRSGTTMMHMAMTAFRGLHFHYEETSLDHPLLRDRLEALDAFRRAGLSRDEAKFYATKRNHGWFERQQLDRLIALTRSEGLGIILMVRDPRDVMLSSHSGRGGLPDYVSPGHWRRSIEGGAYLQDAMAGDPALLLLRYEDLAGAPDMVAQRLHDHFGLTVKPGSAGLGAMAANVASAPKEFDEYLLEAVGEIRDLDPASVGKWRRLSEDPAAPLMADAEIAPIFRRFCKRHDYAVHIEN